MLCWHTIYINKNILSFFCLFLNHVQATTLLMFQNKKKKLYYRLGLEENWKSCWAKERLCRCFKDLVAGFMEIRGKLYDWRVSCARTGSGCIFKGSFWGIELKIQLICIILLPKMFKRIELQIFKTFFLMLYGKATFWEAE